MEFVELIALGFAVYLVASVAQAVTGFGLALVGVPLLIPVVGAVPAVVSSVVVSIALCGRAWWRERHDVDLVLTKRVTLAALLGLPVGLALMTVLSERQLSLMVAAAVVIGVVLLAAVKLPPLGRFGQASGGFASGALLTSTGLNGPPLVITFQAAGLEPRPFRATLQASFLLQDAAALVGFIVLAKVDLATCLVGLGGILGAPAGWALGDRLFRRLSPQVFRWLVMLVLLLTAANSLLLVAH